MEDGVNEVEAAIAAVEAVADGAASEEAAKPEVQETGEATPTNDSVPYHRFKEVNDAKSDLQKQIDEISAKYDEQNKALNNAEKLQTEHGEMSEMLDRIRGMAQVDGLKDHVVAIDNALRGVEQDIEDAGKAAEDADTGEEKNIAQELQKAKESLRDEMQDERASMLLENIRDTAQSYLESLPEEYTESDRKLLGETWWNSRINWDAIETDPAIKNDHLAESFKQLLDDFGTPRGVQPEVAAEDPDAPTPLAQQSPEDQLQKLLDTNWAATDKDGELVVSDDDFNKIASEGMRLARDTS